MSFKASGRSLTLAVSTLFVAGLLPVVAQDPKQEPAKSATGSSKKGYDPARRVPDYFGQIGLSPEQKEDIYKIRAKHVEKIDALKKQILDIQAEMLAECEKILSESQKKQLEFRRSNAAKLKKGAEAPAEGETKEVGKSSDR